MYEKISMCTYEALKSTCTSLLALEKLEHVTLSPSPHLLILLAQHLPLDSCNEEKVDQELLTPWTSSSHNRMAHKLLDRLASTHGMTDGMDQEDAVEKVTLMLIKEDRRLLTRSLQLLQGELQEVSKLMIWNRENLFHFADDIDKNLIFLTGG